MKNESLKYGLVGLLLGGALVWVGTTSAVNSNNTGMMNMMGLSTFNQTQRATTNSIDQHFIEQMIPHHEDAITMAKIAQEKANKPEIKQLAKDIISSQGSEIDQMKDWYKSWFGKEVPRGETTMNQHGMGTKGGMHMGMMGTDMDMTRLENAQDFDKTFIEEMIPHHQMAVMMATMLKGGTQRPEMKQLADEIFTAQTKEIEQMRQWYTDWGYSL